MMPYRISAVKNTQLSWNATMDGTQPVSWVLTTGVEKIIESIDPCRRLYNRESLWGGIQILKIEPTEALV